MRTASSFLAGAFCALAATAAHAQKPAPLPPGGVPAGWKLVWADEFDKPGLPDETKWEYDTALNKQGWHNGELQYYSHARLRNTRVADGKLRITARRERLKNMPDYGGQAFTSGRLRMRDKEFTYAYIAVRAKLPCGKGTWPAIWTLGTEGDWPETGEIDIMEHAGRNPGGVLGGVHTGAFNWPKDTQQNVTKMVKSACSKFHTYALKWTHDSILIGVDGRNFFEFKNSKDGDVQKWPFDKPQYLTINVAVGGNFGGEVNPKVFPQTMEIDYVRVYEP
ncbi:MAG TPA: glycoside hydrolase family 16 protein [Telluria sp.]|nr:glycoside hydrolase family 16 protein [Telluria sp.]